MTVVQGRHWVAQLEIIKKFTTKINFFLKQKKYFFPQKKIIIFVASAVKILEARIEVWLSKI